MFKTSIVLVDKDDNITGHLDKVSAHKDRGLLHRAFSVFIFNQAGELLIHQRSKNKLLWPLFWSNSCCSHPGLDESYESAAKRRTFEELGIECEPEFVYKFIYNAHYLNKGSEHELCGVFLGKTNTVPVINDYEINDWKYISIPEIVSAVQDNHDNYTPWFILELNELTTHYPDMLKKYTR